MYTNQKHMNELRSAQMAVRGNMALYHSTKEEVARDLYFHRWSEAEFSLMLLSDITRSLHAWEFIVANSDPND